MFNIAALVLYYKNLTTYNDVGQAWHISELALTIPVAIHVFHYFLMGVPAHAAAYLVPVTMVVQKNLGPMAVLMGFGPSFFIARFGIYFGLVIPLWNIVNKGRPAQSVRTYTWREAIGATTTQTITPRPTTPHSVPPRSATPCKHARVTDGPARHRRASMPQ